MRNKNKGFTLIEMLVVIAVIGLLAALILVGLSSFRVRGRDTRRIADVKEVQNGLELYYMKNGHYPIVSGTTPNDRWSNLTLQLTDPQENLGITQVPQDPNHNPSDPNNSPSYDYASDAAGQHYVIAVRLEDQKSALLNDDIDQLPFTPSVNIDCTDPVYCVMM
jgi:prepilin-type N-terminal cleavage/methylation domain-containing protein